jgi:hypothetical protein
MTPKLDARKQQIETALRDMYVSNNYTINNEVKIEGSIFDKNISPAESMLVQRQQI